MAVFQSLDMWRGFSCLAKVLLVWRRRHERAPIEGAAPSDVLDRPGTLTALWNCATLKTGPLAFARGKVPCGPNNFLPDNCS